MSFISYSTKRFLRWLNEIVFQTTRNYIVFKLILRFYVHYVLFFIFLSIYFIYINYTLAVSCILIKKGIWVIYSLTTLNTVCETIKRLNRLFFNINLTSMFEVEGPDCAAASACCFNRGYCNRNYVTCEHGM